MWQASFSLIFLVLHLLPGAANRATLDDIVQNDFVIIVNVAIIERKKKIKMGSVNESVGWGRRRRCK